MLTRAVLAAMAASIFIAPVAYAGKKHTHHAGPKHGHVMAHGKTCKKEFMFMKGKKCVDSRKATA